MSAEAAKESVKRERSPSFPYLGLAKAIERIKVLSAKAKRYDVRVADIAKDWGLTPKSSSTDRNVAALIAYGLVEDSGGGENRKIKLSEAGSRILDDDRPGVREALLAEAALKPKIIAEYAQRWHDGRPDDPHAISQLRFEGNFTEEGAQIFLRVYDETIRFTRTGGADKLDDSGGDKPPPPARAKVGDWIQWTSNGVDQFATPVQVTGVSDDGAWLWTDASKTGIPMSEVQSVPPHMPASNSAGVTPKAPQPTAGYREEKFALVEGDVVIRFPDSLSDDSVEDLEAYIQVFLKKAKRAAKKTAAPT